MIDKKITEETQVERRIAELDLSLKELRKAIDEKRKKLKKERNNG